MIEPLHIHAVLYKETTEIKKCKTAARKNPILFINKIVRQEGLILNNRIWNQLEKIVEKNCK